MPASNEPSRRLAENLALVRERIAAACARSGRPASAVCLVGVTKYVDSGLARLLFEAGLADLGESRPQELWAKAEALADLPIRWHLVGHLQRNKVRRTLPLLTLLHSGDSLRLLEECGRLAPRDEVRSRSERTTTLDTLLEINISGDAAKHGFQPGEIEPLMPELAALPGIRICGLMTMAALEGGPDRARRDFAALRELRDRLSATCPPSILLNELSMGMSGDYEVAIEEGATIVRVGSALFEAV
jgi:pyridoxal phosphate enzyme (YggS family)